MESRNLSIFEFFENLQREYICAEVRVKIFEKKYLPYWERAMEGKRAKIEDIASKNRLPSIFSDKEEYLKYYIQVIPEWGKPNFTYRDEEQRKKLEKWDMVFFYNKKVQVKVKEEDDSISIAQIYDNSMVMNDFPILSIKRRGEKKYFLVPLKRIMRIL